jgi:uncharacterized membrane protein YgcG
MRRAAGFGLGIALVLAATAARAERIRDFDVAVMVRPDGTLGVEEHIHWDFEGAERHGIYREIPIAYERPGAADFHIRVHVDAVTDASGTPWPTKTTESGGYLRIRVGDPERTVTGRKDYWLRYHVERGILFFPDHDELYWNATGTEWPVPIDRAAAHVTLPPSTLGAKVDATCYTGAVGSREQACKLTRDAATTDVVASRPLGVREGLTIVIGFPKGTVAEPSALERTVWRLLDYGAHWLLLPIATLVLLVVGWRRTGRDPHLSDAIAVRYEPPPGLTPAEVGTVFDERADMDDVTSTIVDLAIRGWLGIEEVEASQLLFFSHTDYRLRRRPPPSGQTLKPHEQDLLDGLFENGDSVLVSDLREKFYRHLSGIKTDLYKTLSSGDALFAGRPDTIRTAWAFGGSALACVGFLVYPIAGFIGAASLMLSGALVTIGARAMPRRTRRGRAAYEQIVGFREFVRRVEADRLDRLGGRTAATFEKVLPLAIVLGVADRWAEAFAGIYAAPPSWYQGNFDGRSFQPQDLVRNVGRSLDTMGRAMTSTPAGSGSSGFGGGGSSGGGFGGGGGGSW